MQWKKCIEVHSMNKLCMNDQLWSLSQCFYTRMTMWKKKQIERLDIGMHKFAQVSFVLHWARKFGESKEQIFCLRFVFNIMINNYVFHVCRLRRTISGIPFLPDILSSNKNKIERIKQKCLITRSDCKLHCIANNFGQSVIKQIIK